MTVPMLTRDQAGAAVKAAVTERDAIQANLLELDSSFGKQLLAGAELTGDTKRRWEATAATLATLWEVYSAYSAVVDQAAEAAARHLGTRELAALTTLLTGRSVQLASGPAPLAGRDLADSGREDLTLAMAMARMRGAFAAVTEVVAAAEQVWTEIAGRLDASGAELARVTALAATLGDEALTGNLAAVQGKLARLRDTLNSDPLAMWLGRSGPGGPAVDTSGADRLHEEVTGAATQVDELVRLRDDGGRGDSPFGARGRRRRLASGRGEDRRPGAAARARRPGRPVRPAGRPGPAAGQRPVDPPSVRAGPARPRARHRDGRPQGGRTGRGGSHGQT
jgi:hypothetical protein